MATTNDHSHNTQQHSAAVAIAAPADDELATSTYSALSLDRKLAVLESDIEHHIRSGGEERTPLEFGTTNRVFDIASSEPLYTTPREEIQATASIQLSPSLTGESRMQESAGASSAPPPTTQKPLASPTGPSVSTQMETTSTRVTSNIESTTDQSFYSTEQIISRFKPGGHRYQQQEEGQVEEPASRYETPTAKGATDQTQTSTLNPPGSPLDGSNRDAVQAGDGPDSLSTLAHHLPKGAPTSLFSSSLPATAAIASTEFHSSRSAMDPCPSFVFKAGTTTVLDAPPQPVSLTSNNVSKPLHRLSSISAQPSLVSTASMLVASEHVLLTTAPEVPPPAQPQPHHPAMSSSSRKASASTLTSANETGITGPSGGARRPSLAPSATSSSSAQRNSWSDSMPARPQPSRTTTQHTFVAMQPLSRSTSREFSDGASTISATATVVHSSGPSSTASAEGIVTATGVATAGIDYQQQPWDETQFKQLTCSLMSLLEEYEELSDRILESLILTTSHAADRYATGPDLGYGDCLDEEEDEEDGGNNSEWNQQRQHHSYGLKQTSTNGSSVSKGKKIQDGSTHSLPSFGSEAVFQDVDLDRLPLPLYEDQRPWPRGLRRRQQIARQITVLIATGGPMTYASLPPTIQPLSKVIKQRKKAVAHIKDAISTFFSLDNQFQEKAMIVLDILRDPEELENTNNRLLRSRHLNLLADAPTLSATQIDSLDNLVTADHERLAKLTEPLNNVLVSLLMLESNAAKESNSSSGNGGSRTFRESLSALLFPVSFSDMNSTATMNQQHNVDIEQDQQELAQASIASSFWGLGRNRRFALKVAILLLLGSLLIGMGLLINTRS